VRQALRVPLPRLTTLMIERNTLKNGKNKILRTRQKAADPAQKNRSGTKKAGTSKSNANRILPIPHPNAKL